MGWKNIKEHYRIGHIVQVTEAGICIGSPYIHDLIVIGMDGHIVKAYRRKYNDDLFRYQSEMEADPYQVKKLIESPDTFERSITVWTYRGAEIIEKKCEEPGWPNVTHDGELMYENTFSIDRSLTIQRAKENAEAARLMFLDKISETKIRLSEWESDLMRAEADIATLEALTP